MSTQKPLENGGLMGFYGIYPLVMTNIAMGNCHLPIVDMNSDIIHIYIYIIHNYIINQYIYIYHTYQI